jgi:uncharacterized FlgJ-related protein
MTPTITRGFERGAMAFIGALVAAGVVGAALWPMRERDAGPVAPGVSSAVDTHAVPADRTPGAAVQGAKELPAPAVAAGAEPPTITPARPEDVRESLIERLTPIVLSLNQRLLQERSRLWNIRATLQSGGTPTWADKFFLDVMLERYVVSDGNLEELLRRVDAVPPSLAVAAIAQATDWGRRKANPWVSTAQAHLSQSPTAAEQRAVRAEGEDTLVFLTQAYAHALNTDPAYELLRRERQNMRIAAIPLDGVRLAETLPASSAAEAVRAVLLRNGLSRLDEQPSAAAAAAAAVPAAPQDGL